MAKTIAVVNQKGGVGKTTTCVNLTAALKSKGKRVLLCDMDPQGHASIGLGANKRDGKPTIYDVLINGAGIEQVIRKTKHGDLLAANTNLAGAEVEMLSLENRHFILKDALLQVGNNYDFVLIACTPSLGQLTVNDI